MPCYVPCSGWLQQLLVSLDSRLYQKGQYIWCLLIVFARLCMMIHLAQWQDRQELNMMRLDMAKQDRGTIPRATG